MTRLPSLFLISASLIFGPLAVAETKPGDINNGKRLFERNGCYQCHGHAGQGGLAGARLAQTKQSQAGFQAYVRNPRSGMMPPFRTKVMSDQDLADVYAYIKTFPEPNAAKDIPLLEP